MSGAWYELTSEDQTLIADALDCYSVALKREANDCREVSESRADALERRAAEAISLLRDFSPKTERTEE